MADNLFDEFIKKKLEDHSSAVPTDMWDRINAGSKKKRGLAWWRNAGLLLLVTGMITTGFLLHNSENLFTKQAVTENIIDEKNNGDDNELRKVGVTERENEAAKEEEGKKVTAAETESNNSNKSDKKLVAEGNEFRADESKNKELLVAETGKKLVYKTEPGNKISRTSNRSFTNKSANILDKADIKVVGANLPNSFKTESNALSLLALHEKDFRESKANKDVLKNLASSFKIDCPPSYADRRNDWYVEVFASPDYAFKEVNKNSGNEAYLQRKDSSEKFQTAFSGGIRISKSIGEHLLLRSGLQYSQINEKFKYSAESERKTITVVTTHVIIRNPGDTVVIRDTSTAEQISYRYKTTGNRYRSVDLPVIFVYEWGNDDWKANLNAGVIFNLHSWQKGEMLDTSYQPVSFNKNNSNVFKQNLGVGLYAGLTILKPINENMHWFAEPYFRYNLSDMTRDKSPFAQKFHVAGINLGIRYKINGNRQH